MSESVGKVRLDIEIDPNSIAREAAAANRAFSGGMKDTFTRMNNFVKDSMSRMASSFRSMVPGEAKDAPMEMGEQLEALVAQMDNASNMAEMYRQRLKDLTEHYDSLDTQSKRVGFGEKLYEDMLKTEDRMLRYGARSDKLRLEIEKLEDATAQAGDTTEKAGRQIVKAGDQAKKAQGKMGGFGNSLQKVFTRVLRQIFIFAVLYKAIRGMTGYMSSAIGVNQEFARSLAQVKTNLQVAFMPIYQAILPALQALMRALAVATTYIATFTSVLFGKTYKASFAAAKGLNAAKAAMEGYGKAAKKTMGALAGFDEIHVLGSPAEDAGGGAAGVDLAAPPIETGPLEASMGRVKEFFATIFQPFRTAWDAEGATVIASARYAFGGILGLLGNIGESLMEVWGEVGPGAIETFLKIIGISMNLLGHLAEALMWVWDHGGEHLLKGLVRLGAKVLELSSYIYAEFVAPFMEWFLDLIAPALATVLDWAGWLLDKFVELIDWLLGDGKPVLDTIVTILGSMAVAFGLVTIAMGIYNGIIAIATALSTAFGAVMAFVTSPIGLVVLAIGALIAIGVLLYKNWDTISAKAKDIFGKLKTFIKGICDSVSGFFKNMVNGVIRALNSMIGGLNKLKFDVPDWIPIIGGKKFGFSIPKIPQLARGGIVDQPTLAMIGEKRKKEAVVPLERDASWKKELAAELKEQLGQDGTDNTPVSIYLSLDGTVFGKLVAKSLRDLMRQGGGQLIPV